MKITRRYRRLEKIEEVHVYDVSRSEYYLSIPREFEVDDVLFPELMSNIPFDIHILSPYCDGKDFIIVSVGNVTIREGKFTQDDVTGRLLSNVTPVFHDILYDSIFEVYKTHKLKKLRLFYYPDNNLVSITNIKILYDGGKIFILTDFTDTRDYSENSYDMDKYNMMEYFSQTGSYNIIDGKYFWSQGVYNIINRPMDESDEYYNILFDLAIPEDKAVVERIVKIMDEGTSHHKDIIRITTWDGELKYIELDLYSTFDENGELINRQGLVNDITQYSRKNIVKPVDFLLNGFGNSKKLALLIEPLNPTQYEFSQGFYHIIETCPEDYTPSRRIFDNIAEKEVVDNLIKLYDGQIEELDETFTYKIGNSEKICEVYIERFQFGSETHSIGFLTDISEEKKKQEALIVANEHQKILIKEVHHRVKNNLQILNSFLNLEKRAYKDNPEIIIDHMQSRLSSLAILHKKTYDASDFKNINLKDFITDQDNQFKILLGVNNIEFVSEIDESLNLSIEVITPLSLIINELMLNSIKHAFPDESINDKKIIKKISKIDEKTGKLIIMDNGIGIRDEGKFQSNLGCEIVKNLTRQLNGEIRLLNLNEGTGFELTFPLMMTHTISQ